MEPSTEEVARVCQELLNASEPYLNRQKGTRRSDCQKLNMVYKKVKQTLEEFKNQKTRKKENT